MTMQTILESRNENQILGIKKNTSSKDAFGYFLLFVYLFIEYVRPMDDLRFLQFIRPGMIVSLLLIISWFASGHLNLFNSSPQTKMVWLFILLLAIFIPFAMNNYWAYTVTKSVLMFIPFFLSAIFYIQTFDRLRKIINFWIILMVYLSIKGILGKGVAGSGFLEDENDFALLINMMVPFSLFLFVYEQNSRKKLGYLLVSILAVLSVMASFSRGGFVGLLSVFTVFWLFSPKKVISLILAAILLFVIYYSADQTYWTRISTTAETDQGTAKQRLDSWKAGWEMFKSNPFGVGGGNFPVRFPEYQSNSFSKGMYGRAAHSLWFTLLSELGILGVVIYGFLIFYNLRDIFWLKKKGRLDENLKYPYYLSLAFLASFIGFFSSGTFLSVLYYPHFFYLTALVVATRKLSEQYLKLNL